MGAIRKIYTTLPTSPLYHYTSLKGLQGIIESKSVWATNVFYLNDASEVSHAISMLDNAINEKLKNNNNELKEFLNQFLGWLKNSAIDRHQIFVCSFTEDGNLLSQWRGYSQLGQGISIGINQEDMIFACEKQEFTIIKCIYDIRQKKKVINEFLDKVLGDAIEFGPNNDPSKRRPSQSYYDMIEAYEPAFLEIASALKHPSFAEEKEWRIISPLISDLKDERINYRITNSTMIPYIKFNLALEEGCVIFEDIIVGPTPHMNLSMNSIPNYLTRMKVKCRNGVHNSQLPYRGL